MGKIVRNGGVIWPLKKNILGVNISATTYEEALISVMDAAKIRRSCCVTHLAVHGLVEGVKDLQFRTMLESFEIVAPDGQPIRRALRILYGIQLSDRCYGPEFMIRVCQRAEREGIGIYLYGSYQGVVDALRNHLIDRFPKLSLVGWEPSIFRPLTEAEDAALVHRINDSKAGIVFVGLGCPLQEKFAFAHRGKIQAVQICVGAAFDFHSGNKKMAPGWMQRNSLEWFYRLLQEPRRLWKRYLVTNFTFMFHLLLQVCGLKKF